MTNEMTTTLKQSHNSNLSLWVGLGLAVTFLSTVYNLLTERPIELDLY